MPIRITQIDMPDTARTTLRVEGTLKLEDVKLIEKICCDVKQRSGKSVMLDLADLCFLDSDSAHLLCRLKAEQDVSFEGLHLFAQRVIEMAEQNEKSEEDG
ncbi:MAG: hypothetical protein ACRD9R_03005 [Pyrinomonadaceae bacterium]